MAKNKPKTKRELIEEKFEKVHKRVHYLHETKKLKKGEIRLKRPEFVVNHDKVHEWKRRKVQELELTSTNKLYNKKKKALDILHKKIHATLERKNPYQFDIEHAAIQDKYKEIEPYKWVETYEKPDKDYMDRLLVIDHEITPEKTEASVKKHVRKLDTEIDTLASSLDISKMLEKDFNK